MSAIMTPAQRQAIRERVEATTAGPWYQDCQPNGPCGAKMYREHVASSVTYPPTLICLRPTRSNPGIDQVGRSKQTFADMVFIAHAPSDIHALLAENEERAKTISECLRAMPHGNMATHTAENLPARISELAGECGRLADDLATAQAETMETFREWEKERDETARLANDVDLMAKVVNAAIAWRRAERCYVGKESNDLMFAVNQYIRKHPEAQCPRLEDMQGQSQ